MKLIKNIGLNFVVCFLIGNTVLRGVDSSLGLTINTLTQKYRSILCSSNQEEVTRFFDQLGCYHVETIKAFFASRANGEDFSVLNRFLWTSSYLNRTFILKNLFEFAERVGCLQDLFLAEDGRNPLVVAIRGSYLYLSKLACRPEKIDWVIADQFAAIKLLVETVKNKMSNVFFASLLVALSDEQEASNLAASRVLVPGIFTPLKAALNVDMIYQKKYSDEFREKLLILRKNILDVLIEESKDRDSFLKSMLCGEVRKTFYSGDVPSDDDFSPVVSAIRLSEWGLVKWFLDYSFPFLSKVVSNEKIRLYRSIDKDSAWVLHLCWLELLQQRFNWLRFIVSNSQ